MIASVRAAWFADRKRPAVWTVTLTWIVLALAFGVGVPYLVHLALAGDPKQAASAASLLDAVLPGQLVTTGIGLFPLFGGAIVVILGALVVGNEYRWGTLNLIFTQRPRRAQVLAGHAVALCALTLLLVALTFAALAGVTALLALIEGRGLRWPATSDLAGAVGAAWLICGAHASVGYFLAIVFRSTATAIAVGLVWTLVLENAISGLALVLSPLEMVQKLLLAPSSGALAGALGARSQFDGGTPGVIESSGAGLPAAVLAGYVVLMFGLGIWLAVRRDVS
ncbi:ABC-type transport system involved in multi-copper enzyme maturation, permease component [Micromonospora coriariae]|uniref:ABC-type transport system involved in multi-copper enzyme maturation, permease component n=1 Tax=Micromonospora coriariae TaxID=285665 RepID=A0A1C4Y7H4_9ACTN|nr:ABC transporter permease subunit [Micromonospora coriariae]SCF16673.1 ABC-type transport system involved in multi-copper enzyme maturation, permease component [Micromonospora coriariae]